MRWEGSMSRLSASNLRMGNPVLTADFSWLSDQNWGFSSPSAWWFLRAELGEVMRSKHASDLARQMISFIQGGLLEGKRPEGWHGRREPQGSNVSRLLKLWSSFSPAEKLPLILSRGPNSHLQSQWMCWWRLGGLSQPQRVHNRESVFHRSIWVKTSRNWACKSDANSPNGDFEH